MATASAPASRARSGVISGTGLASAKTSGFGAIARTICGVRTPPAERPMKTSEPVMTSPSEPVRRSLFVSRAISSFEKSMCSARPS